jgi:hypothetical protein
MDGDQSTNMREFLGGALANLTATGAPPNNSFKPTPLGLTSR